MFYITSVRDKASISKVTTDLPKAMQYLDVVNQSNVETIICCFKGDRDSSVVPSS